MTQPFKTRYEQFYMKEKTGSTNPSFAAGDKDLGDNGLSDDFNVPGSSTNRQRPGRYADGAPEFDNAGEIIREFDIAVDWNDNTAFLAYSEGKRFRCKRYLWLGASAPTGTINAASDASSSWRIEEFDYVVSGFEPSNDEGFRMFTLSGAMSGALTVTTA